MDFSAYAACYNEGDEARLGALFYTEDIVYDGGNRRYEGRDNFVHYLEAVGAGIRQTLVPVTVVREGAHLMAELDIEFRALEDKPGFPFGALRTGEAMTLRFFGSYTLRDGRICRIHLANWNTPIAGKGAEQ